MLFITWYINFTIAKKLALPLISIVLYSTLLPNDDTSSIDYCTMSVQVVDAKVDFEV